MLKHLKKIHLSIFILLILQACGSSESLEITNARIRPPSTINQALGGFMVLKNNTDKPMILVDVKAHGFKQVMLHKTINKDGMHTMKHQERIVIPANSEVVFKHGSYHIMFMGSTRLVKAGDTIPVTLVFANGDEKPIIFAVKKAS